MRFIADSLDRVGVQIVRLGTADLENIVQVSRRFGLDFDDAYQYVAAEKHNLTIVSFDSDFDRTERGRKTPAEVVRSEEA